MANVKRNWFRHNSGVFLPRPSSDTVPVPYFARCGHCEVWFQTNASFGGSFSVSAVPSNSTAAASTLGIFVDGVLNQTVQFDVGAGLNKQQTILVNTGSPGSHVIRVQEGERDPGCFLTQVTIDGTVIPAPAITRAYLVFGDSVSMGAFSDPRSSGWAPKMRFGTRFDSVVLLGQSGYSMSVGAFDATSRAAAVAKILQPRPTTSEALRTWFAYASA